MAQNNENYNCTCCARSLFAEKPSIDVAAELAATLADIPAEPKALDGLPGML